MIGRNTVVHEYPKKKDGAYVEDMGPKVRTFTLTLFVLGDDVFAQRDAFEAALEKEGPGELIHPWRGRMLVSVTDCRASETIEQGGRCSWTVTFTQTGENKQPSVRADTQALVDVAADNAIAVVANDFAETFGVDGLPEFVEQDALSQINTVLDTVLAAGRGMLPNMSVLPSFIQKGASILGKVTQLMRLSTSLASTITAQIASLLGLGASPLSALNALKNLFGSSYEPVNRTTPSRIQQDNNRQAVASITRRTAIIEAARTSASIDFDNQTQALQVRDDIVDAIEAEQLTAPDAVYETLADLRTAVTRDISTRANDIAKLIEYTPTNTVPALAVAYHLYGDATKDADIIKRNPITHPGFVRGGQVLEVLTDD